MGTLNAFLVGLAPLRGHLGHRLACWRRSLQVSWFLQIMKLVPRLAKGWV